MHTYSKILILLLLFESCSFLLYAQSSDSVPAAKPVNISGDSLLADSTKKKTSQLQKEKFTPDTVFLINGDKFTGNIISFNDGRLKIDAQGAGIINIKSGLILTISGGSRIFKVEDLLKQVYIGLIQFSKDTGKIIIVNKLTYEIMFSDMASLFPLSELKDSLKEAPASEHKVEHPVALKHLPDTVTLKNGERYTGNIQSFEQGKLKIDAQGTGVIYIKWYKIAGVNGGDRFFKVEDRNGEIYIGSIKRSKDFGAIDVINSATYSLLLADIVRVFPLEREWYRGFKGNMGAGLNYTKSSDVLNVNANYNLYYVVQRWRFINNLSYIETKSDNETPSLRVQIDFQALYKLFGKWLAYEINSYNKNDELGIKSRISFGAGVGNSLIQTEKQRLLALTGIIQNSERSFESNNVFSSFEWPATLQHTMYSFLNPNITADTKITSYVGITEKGRYRIDASTDVSWEFIKWVKLMLTAYYNYDNKVVEGKKSQRDYGTVLSLSFDLK